MDDTISQNTHRDINLCRLHKTSLMTWKKLLNIMCFCYIQHFLCNVSVVDFADTVIWRLDS